MIEVWKVYGEEQYFVRFAPTDRLVFDLRHLSQDQYDRLVAQEPMYRRVARVDHGEQKLARRVNEW